MAYSHMFILPTSIKYCIISHPIFLIKNKVTEILMKMITCKNCNCLFIASPRHKNQHYCKKPECRKAYKAEWQSNKINTDSDYKANQKACDDSWKKNPYYWKEYRQKNPDKVERNKVMQIVRNRKKSGHDKNEFIVSSNKSNKMELSNLHKFKIVMPLKQINNCKDGFVNLLNIEIDSPCCLIPEIVKMDSSKISIHIISTDYP